MSVNVLCSGPDLIDYAPCLIANTPAGVSGTASAITIDPQLIDTTPYGTCPAQRLSHPASYVTG